MQTELDAFLVLYEQMKDKILMPNFGNHALDEQQIEEYINTFCNQDMKDIIKFVLDNTTYIDFNTFLNNFKKLLNEVYLVHTNGNNEIRLNYVFIIPGYNIKKSTMWMSLIAYMFMPKNMSLVQIVDSIENFAKITDDVIGIISDDCSYSGTQLANIIIPYNKVTFEITNKLYLAVPYISHNAHKLFIKRYDDLCYDHNIHNSALSDYLVILDKVILIDNIYTVAKNKNFNIFEKDVIFKFDLNSNDTYSFLLDVIQIPFSGCLIYFDHKIADNLSTIQFFLNYSRVIQNSYVAKINIADANQLFNLNNSVEYTNSYYKYIPKDKYILNACATTDREYYELILNCKKEFKKFNPNVYEKTLDLNTDSKMVCPITYYKTYNFYTFNNEPLKVSNLKDFAKLLYQGGSCNFSYEKKYLIAKKEYVRRLNLLR